MKRLCVTSGCGNVTLRGGRCPECKREHERTINRAGAGLYGTKRWRMTRRKKLHLDPICELCDTAIAEEVHHRVPLADGGDPYALDGLVSCCKPCHSRETRREQLERRAVSQSKKAPASAREVPNADRGGSRCRPRAWFGNGLCPHRSYCRGEGRTV